MMYQFCIRTKPVGINCHMVPFFFFFYKRSLQMQTLTCRVDSIIIPTVPFTYHPQSWGASRLHSVGLSPRYGMHGYFWGKAYQSNFADFEGWKKGWTNMKVREENPGWDPTCLICHPGSWQTIRPTIRRALMQAHLRIRAQISPTLWLISL